MLRRLTRIFVPLLGGSIAVGFPLGVFSGILEGLQKFYLLNLVNILSTTLRAVLIIVALNRGGGLIVIAFITVLLPLGNSIVNAVAALRQLKIRVHRKYVDTSTLRLIAGYSSTTLLITVASRLRFKTDALVIGTFVSASAITYFSIGSRLVDYCGELVSSLANIHFYVESVSGERRSRRTPKDLHPWESCVCFHHFSHNRNPDVSWEVSD